MRFRRQLVGAIGAAAFLVGCSAAPGVSTSSGEPGKTNPAPATTSQVPTGPDSTPAPSAFASISAGGVRYGPTKSGPLDGKTIVVDPGHNKGLSLKGSAVFGTRGQYCQALGGTGLDKVTMEHTINWRVASKLLPMLREQGAVVWMTRPDDEGKGPCNGERAEIANRNNADFLISLHSDGVANPRLRGFYAIYAKQSAGGKALLTKSEAAAFKVIDAMKKYTKMPSANYGGREGGVPIEQLDLGVLNNATKTPAVLLEMGNMIHADDWAILNSDAGQADIATAMLNASVAVATGS